MTIINTGWDNAQSKELNSHLSPLSRDGVFKSSEHYEYGYSIVFKYLGIDLNSLKDKRILEIGPALFPACFYVTCKKSSCIEPLFNKFPDAIKELYKNKNIEVFIDPAEDFLYYSDFDEIWIFNLLQHVRDPKSILLKCKESCKVLRIFEPINTPTDDMHLHTLEVEFFRQILGESFGQIYQGGSIPNFHGANCIYGTYKQS